MIMGNFTFIIPSDWGQVTGADLEALDVNAVINMIAGGQLGDLTDRMRDLGILTADEGVSEARVFEGIVLAYRK